MKTKEQILREQVNKFYTENRTAGFADIPDFVFYDAMTEYAKQENKALNGYVKIEDACYIEDCFDNNDNLIDGRFTGVYLKIKELESKRI